MTASVSYRDPCPAAWRRLVCISQRYDLQLPGAEFPQPVRVRTAPPQSSLNSSEPLALSFSPVRNIRINNESATAELSEVGETPRIAWELPSSGAPTEYTVVLNRLEPEGTSTAHYEAVAWFTTPNVELVLPAGLLDSGDHYAVCAMEPRLLYQRWVATM